MIKCIAVDDEPIALSIISRFCERCGEVSLQTFTNPTDALRVIVEQVPDLVFLDVEMNDVSGLVMARELPERCLLVFTTAYANYALEGFELSAVDFLHKPFSYQRFAKTMDKVGKILRGRSLVWQQMMRVDRRLTLKVEYKNVSVAYNIIVYVEAMDNYVKVFCNDGRCIISQVSLKAIESLLPEDEFLRVHKSYMVRRDKILSFTRRQLELAGGAVVPVGRIYSERVGELL